VEDLPLDGIVPKAWRGLVCDTDDAGEIRINRIAYELCVLSALREKLRCKEIWVPGADRYRNPDDDLPGDFEQNRDAYHAALGLPLDPNDTIARLQAEMDRALSALDTNIPANPDVEIKRVKGRFKLSPLEAQPEPENLPRLKTAISNRWQIVSLLDVLKETDYRVNFTRHFRSAGQREIIDAATLRKRLLLNIYAMGTNAGIKRILAGNHGEQYHDLMYVQRRFMHKPYLRQAIADVVNAILAARRPGSDDLLAYRKGRRLHLLSTQTVLLLRGGRHDRGCDAPLHGDGRQKAVRG
jgi:hypothetical protein